MAHLYLSFISRLTIELLIIASEVEIAIIEALLEVFGGNVQTMPFKILPTFDDLSQFLLYSRQNDFLKHFGFPANNAIDVVTGVKLIENLFQESGFDLFAALDLA